MTAEKCRDCHRPLRAPESQERERGSKCWRAHRATFNPQSAALGNRRRTWVPDMPGQETLEDEQPGGGSDA
jgi:hypothetical protein